LVEDGEIEVDISEKDQMPTIHEIKESNVLVGNTKKHQTQTSEIVFTPEVNKKRGASPIKASHTSASLKNFPKSSQISSKTLI
jgi:hypothetical protein